MLSCPLKKKAGQGESAEGVGLKQEIAPVQTIAAGINEEREQTEIADEAEPTPIKTEYLPDTSPEEQYRFALARALQNDLQTAENVLCRIYCAPS